MNIAVIGLGGIGRRHVANFRTLGCEVRAYDADPSRTEAASLDEALDGADGVVIATPPDSHMEVAAAARRGRRDIYVMIEKPLGVTVKRLRAPSRVPQSSHTLVAYPWRHWPPLQYVKRLLDEGRIGRILSAHTEYGCHFEKHMPHHAERPDSYLRSLARGGGCLLEMSHAIDYMRWLCGEITEVSGVVETRVLKMDADDCADLTVRFASGATGGLHLSLWLSEITGRLEITGENGALSWDRAANLVTLTEPDGLHVYKEYRRLDINAMYPAEAAHFLAVIRGGAQPVCDGHDGLQTLKVIDAARRASAEKRWVTV